MLAILKFYAIFLLVGIEIYAQKDKYERQVTDRVKAEKLAKFLVSVRLINREQPSKENVFCTGAIVNSRAIVIGALCLFPEDTQIKASDISVVANDFLKTDEMGYFQRVKVASYVIHPQFIRANVRKSSFANVALLFLDEALREDDVTVQRIELNSWMPQEGWQCKILGWGLNKTSTTKSKSKTLHFAELTIMATRYCRRNSPVFPMPSDIICATALTDENRNICHEPYVEVLICDQALTGIFSYGEGCSKDHPGFYTNINLYRTWIKRNSGSSKLKFTIFWLYVYILFT